MDLITLGLARAYTNSVALGSGTVQIPGPPGANGRNVELFANADYIVWRWVGDTAWNNLVSLSALQGAQGRSVDLRISGDTLEWRREGDTAWLELYNFTGGDGGAQCNNLNSFPQIIRVKLPASQTSNFISMSGSSMLNPNNRYIHQGVILEFDKPAPANAYIQFHRYSKKSGRRGASSFRPRKGFRPIDVFAHRSGTSVGMQWHLPIPMGATSISTAPIINLYRPPRLRGQHPAIFANPHLNLGRRNATTPDRRFANKCHYKFSICVLDENGLISGAPSEETLEIINWVWWGSTGLIANIY